MSFPTRTNETPSVSRGTKKAPVVESIPRLDVHVAAAAGQRGHDRARLQRWAPSPRLRRHNWREAEAVGMYRSGADLVVTLAGKAHTLRLVETRTPTGGPRTWATCPGCGDVVAHLYAADRLACRVCLGAIYACQERRHGR